MKKLISAILLGLGLSYMASAQSLQLPTQFGLSGFVYPKHSYAVLTSDILNLYRGVKTSVDVQDFVGVGTNAAGVVGTAITGSWTPIPNLSLVFGPGVPIALAQFSWSQVTVKNIGLMIGASYHFSMASSSPKSATVLTF